MNDDSQHSFGVFKPVGYVLISFPGVEQATNALRALSDIGIGEGECGVRYLSDQEMLRHTEDDMANAGPLASIGQELNLARAHRELAGRGYHWLLVRAKNDGRAFQIADCVRPYGAERAQYYGRFVIEELIEHASDTQQVAESPDRGLNAQTPSGHAWLLTCPRVLPRPSGNSYIASNACASSCWGSAEKCVGQSSPNHSCCRC